MKDSQSTQSQTTPPTTSIVNLMDSPITKIIASRNMVETVRMAHHCPTDDIDFAAMEDVMRIASKQMQDALNEIEDILKEAA